MWKEVEKMRCKKKEKICGLLKIDEVDEQMTLHEYVSNFIICFVKFWMNLDTFTTVKVVDL
jgi:hypothetical protein